MIELNWENVLKRFGGIRNTDECMLNAYSGEMLAKLPDGWTWEELLARYFPTKTMHLYLLQQILMCLENNL